MTHRHACPKDVSCGALHQGVRITFLYFRRGLHLALTNHHHLCASGTQEGTCFQRRKGALRGFGQETSGWLDKETAWLDRGVTDRR